jgi:hypothetical protein
MFGHLASYKNCPVLKKKLKENEKTRKRATENILSSRKCTTTL